jgi:hypothetical protein
MNKWVVYTMAVLTIGMFVWWHWPQSYNYPPQYEIEGFRFVEQPDHITCGPTSALMLLRRYGKEVELAEVQSQTKTKWLTYKGEPIGLTSPDYISRAVSYFGVSAHLRHGDLSQLKYLVSQRKPVIVLLRSGKLTWHYVVVIGYTHETIITADPSGGYRDELPVKHFLGAWTFLTDMEGTGVVGDCPACRGTGHWLWFDFGPFSICEVCGGAGKQPDYAGAVVRTAEVYPYTMIIPSAPLDR